MLKAQTKTARFKSQAVKVQNFIGNAENLPKWATNFCLGIKKSGEDYIVTTPDGEVFFRIESNPENGIVDMWSGPSRDTMIRWPARIVDDNTGGSVFAFTAIQIPGQPDEEFAGLCKALEEEFENIRSILDG